MRRLTVLWWLLLARAQETFSKSGPRVRRGRLPVDQKRRRHDGARLHDRAAHHLALRRGRHGTLACPSVTVHDASTAISMDPEFPFVLRTMQAHRAGGSFISAAAIPRGQPIGFAVNVNVKFRGRLNVNLGCDRRSFFDLSVLLQG
jgi:hypothetical protein